jgi:2-polyprenyl-3-methyl-5-hydroxy-6-metoxy-1,4-benzoquinol methylase
MTERTGYFDADRHEVASLLPSRYSKVLEVGCATGGFSGHLVSPCEYWGIEPNLTAASAAKQRINHVLTGTYEEVESQLPEGYFDLVICNDVIEHMVDHDAFLRRIKKKMTPDGVIVGSIPNVRHITALAKLLILKDWPYADSGILDRTHLRFFTARSLRRTFDDHGYQIEVIRGLASVIRLGLFRPAKPLSVWMNAAFRLGTLSVVAVTLGSYWDTQYPQFGFRVRLRPG